MRQLNLKSKDFTPGSIQPPPKRNTLPEATDLRAAADHNPIGSGVPLVAETEAAQVKYDRAKHFTLKFVGRSMYPTMREGDRLIIEHVNLFMPIYDEDRGSCDPKIWQPLDKKVVIALIDDDALQAVIKRLDISHQKKMGFRVMLLSDNRSVKPIEIREDNCLRIIGIVREIIRDPANFE